jgi:hypothetical protein
LVVAGRLAKIFYSKDPAQILVGTFTILDNHQFYLEFVDGGSRVKILTLFLTAQEKPLQASVRWHRREEQHEGRLSALPVCRAHSGPNSWS